MAVSITDYLASLWQQRDPIVILAIIALFIIVLFMLFCISTALHCHSTGQDDRTQDLEKQRSNVKLSTSITPQPQDQLLYMHKHSTSPPHGAYENRSFASQTVILDLFDSILATSDTDALPRYESRVDTSCISNDHSLQSVQRRMQVTEDDEPPSYQELAVFGGNDMKFELTPTIYSTR